MRDDQMMCGVDGDLDVVADDARAAAAGRHRAGIRIGQRYLLVRCGKHLHLENLEPLHLLLQHRDLLFQAARLGLERLGRLLPVGGVELLQIARDALLDLRHAPLHLGAREVLVAIVHRLELAAVDRHAGLREQAHRAAQRNEPGANLADGAAIVLAEVGNRLVIGSKAAREPHHLNVAPGLTLKPAARLHPVEIAVNVELQQDRRMIRRPAGCLGIDPAEPKLGQIEFVDKDVNHPNRIVLADPVFQAFGKQRALTAIRPLNEAPHLIPPQIARESYRQNQIQQRVFTQPGSFATIDAMSGACPLHPQ